MVVPKSDTSGQQSGHPCLRGRAARKERCEVNSGTFGRELMAFSKALASLVEDVKVLVASDIYRQRLRRCLSHPDNQKALEDFLVQDRICWDLCDLVGGEDAAALWEARKDIFYAVDRVTDVSGPRGRVLWKSLLHWAFMGRSAEGIWKELKWE